MTPDPDMRYRFDIVGHSVVDIVTAAGGWLYDRATAGWDVSVMMLDAFEGTDTRPLQILGARVLDLASVLTHWEQWPHPQTIAVCAQMFDGHARVRQGVLDALEHSSTEVTLWGDVPAELHRDVDTRQHRLSAAARAFKAQALRAAGIDPKGVAGSGHIEKFRCGPACASVAADLSPAS
ncbi:hypothetical protein [Mycolicibacter senuensis]|uniref:Uncharacterized protein n=1 Tax=Mycolicibacter senuensis TaxID=386913 RepID=A0A7I9XLJ7_9MYCO|nr:hypothetical protein [Mycolicibacter senuensis]MDQ2625783.1 hypothetical protein [Actinomycetota bacterium]ORW64342.1 hypothetical protein AWC24_00735 [Mycolicibacter senuensis]GFG70779.1 hypothetical protein MSEN_24990 [Mycolicibacter senuensis]